MRVGGRSLLPGEQPVAAFPWVPLPGRVPPVRAAWVRAAYEEVAWARHQWLAAVNRYSRSAHPDAVIEWNRLMAAERNYKRVRGAARAARA